MTTDTTRPGSRRALLTAGVAAVAASVAAALGRPEPVRAGSDGDVILGSDLNVAAGLTRITNSSTGADVLQAISVGGGTGVSGSSGSNMGVRGDSGSFIGVYGGSSSYIGVYGGSYAADRPATLGYSIGNSTGVLGYSNPLGNLPAVPAKTGVYGVAGQDGTSVGIRGDSATGAGVVGFSGSGVPLSRPKTGLYGQANQGAGGVGVRGHSTTGTGVYASSGTGAAFRAVGRVKLDNCAGVATIVSGSMSVTVTPGIDLVSASAVVASLMGSAGGTITVHRSVVNAIADTFTIYLTANASADVKVAWHVFG